jgi:hypothetical protein
MSSQEKRIPFYARDLWIAGLVGLPLGHWFLFAQIEPFYSGIYTFLWWPFIFVLDFLVYRLRHESLLQDRPREFLLLALWSTPLWLLFEAFNFRLQNWTYIQVPLLWSDLSSWFMIPAYATVLPALFEGADLMSAVIERLTHGRGLQGKPFQVRERDVKIQMAVGVAMLALPMLWPGLFFCLIWGFAFFFFDPFCYRRQGPSLLGQLARGQLTRLVALLLSGLMCGGLWEGWNIAARSKWLYTVPGFDDLKIFEMPVLGFLGFPPFALECYALVNFLNLFRGGRSWERRGLDNLRGRGMRPRVVLWGWAATIVFSCLVYEGIFVWSVTSYSIPIENAIGAQMNKRERLILWNEGVSFPHQFLARWGQATPESETEEKISAVLPHGFDPESFVRLRALSTLSEIKGIGLHHAVTLESLGVRTPLDLAQQDPGALVARMRQAVRADLAPSEAVARIWVVAAKAWTRRHAPVALQSEEGGPWENWPDEEDTSCTATTGHPLDLDREAEASSRTQSPTLPQAIHPDETTSQPRELTLYTTATKTVQPVSPPQETVTAKGTAEAKGTSGTVAGQVATETTSSTQPVQPEDARKTSSTQERKTEPAKPAEAAPKAPTEPLKPEGEQKTTSATEPVKPAVEVKKTSDTQKVKPEEKPKEESRKEEGQPESKKLEEKSKEESGKVSEEQKEESGKTPEKPKEEPQKAQKAQKETSATEPVKPAVEVKKTSDTQTAKPGEKPKEEAKRPEEETKKAEEKPKQEEPKAEAKKSDEKPKEEAKKAEEKSKEESKPEEKAAENAKKSEEKPKDDLNTVGEKPQEAPKKTDEKSKDESGKTPEKSKEEPQKVQKAQKETSATEPVKPAVEVKKTSDTQTAKPGEKPKDEVKKAEEKPKEAPKKADEKSKDESGKTPEKPKEEPQKAQKAQKETSATEPVKPEEKPKQEGPKADAKKPDEKPKEEAQKADEKPKEVGGKQESRN